VYISRLIPTKDYAKFYAFGRVFSGTIQTGAKIRIQGPFYKPGSDKDVYVRTV
jgi:elongation factor 2